MANFALPQSGGHGGGVSKRGEVASEGGEVRAKGEGLGLRVRSYRSRNER